VIEETERLAVQARAETLGVFEARHPHPFLLVQIAVEDEKAAFMTVAQGDLEPPEYIEGMAPIAKRGKANAFSYISVGRASNNDIVIQSAQISKCHIVFEQRDGKYTVTDLGSKNGTVVNGKPLTRHQKVDAQIGDVIVLAGSVNARILDARSAYRWLRMR
jgi:hypothetical protein